MKRIGNLYEKVIAIDNLKLADEKARKGIPMACSSTTRTGKRTFLHCMKVWKTELSRHPNITFSQFLSQRNGKSINCHIIPTASCIMRWWTFLNQYGCPCSRTTHIHVSRNAAFMRAPWAWKRLWEKTRSARNIAWRLTFASFTHQSTTKCWKVW